MKSHDEAALLSVQFMKGVEEIVIDVAVGREVWVIYDVS